MGLTTGDHDRDAIGLRYVYPVVSRRARGVSLGINLNPNKACNWRCVYCQVPGLTFGNGPAIDLELLRRELASTLDAILEGDFLEREVDPAMRRLNDLALSGDGEPTSSPELLEVVEVIASEREKRGGLAEVATVLITNGSLMHQERVQRAVARLADLNGRVWYKLDSATAAGQEAINQNRAGTERAFENLATCAGLAPTWLQTCVFAMDGAPPSGAEQAAYLERVGELLERGVRLQGVLLYGLARPSHQPEAPRLRRLPDSWLRDFGERIRALGLEVAESP